MSKQRVVNRDANAANRVALAVQLRAQRLTYEAIAQQCGYKSIGACRDAIMRELDRRIVKNVDELRREELDMLDQLHCAVWPLAVPGPDAVDSKGRKKQPYLEAVDRVLAISERRSKLLGLDMKPEAHQTQQNYIKRIILTHEVGGEHVG